LNFKQLEEKYRFLLNECSKHLELLQEDFELLKEFLPLDGKTVKRLYTNRDYLKTFDQIAYRFSKLQDSLGKLLRVYMLLKGESVESLPTLDLVELANRYGFPIDSELWLELRVLRNSITHDYPDSYGEIAQALNKISKLLPLLEESLSFFGKPLKG